MDEIGEEYNCMGACIADRDLVHGQRLQEGNRYIRMEKQKRNGRRELTNPH